MARIAFFGVGTMGEPMAVRLLEAGHAVTVVAHRNRSAVDRLVVRGAVEAAAPAEAALGTDMAILMLPTARDGEEVLFGPRGVASAMRSGYTVIDMGTGFRLDTRRIASRLVEAGGRYIDAPVTGGPKGAADGTLTIMVGGDGPVLEAVHAVLKAMGAQIYHFGSVGAGHGAKLVQNMIGIIGFAAIAEALVLATAVGLDPQQLFEMLSASTSNSPALQYMVPKVLQGEFDRVGFRLDWAFKDIRQAADLARETTVPLPTTNGAMELFQLARACGYGGQDATAVIRGLETVLGTSIRMSSMARDRQ